MLGVPHAPRTFDGVFKHLLAERGGDGRAVGHARAAVDLDQPRPEVLRQHEVSTVQFKCTLQKSQMIHGIHVARDPTQNITTTCT